MMMIIIIKSFIIEHLMIKNAESRKRKPALKLAFAFGALGIGQYFEEISHNNIFPWCGFVVHEEKMKAV